MDQIQQEIEAKGLTAPRVTPADIEAEIVGEYYASGEGAFSNNYLTVEHSASLRLMTLCVLLLRNGCKVVGVNHGPVDPANFDAEHGRRDAREDAIRQVWPLLGFRLRDQLARGVLTEADAAADLAGTPRPDWKGEPLARMYIGAPLRGIDVDLSGG